MQFLNSKRSKLYHLRVTLQSSSNALSPTVHFFGTSTSFILVFENALSPILFNDYGNLILVNDEQLLKHSFPIVVTPSGIVIVEIFVFENA